MMNPVTTLKNSTEFNHEDNVQTPFAIFEHETIIPAKNLPASILPTELDYHILSIVEKTLFCTSALIRVQLERCGIEFDETNVKRRIKRMCESDFLEGYRFQTADEKLSAYAVYKLGWRGAGFLKAHGTHPRLNAYLANVCKDPIQTKKILSAAQLVIRTGLQLEDTAFCQAVFVPTKNSTKSTKIFRPHAIVRTGQETLIIEAVRQNEGWADNFLEKLGRMETVCRSRSTNVPIHNPALVLVAENCAHMNMLLHMLERRGCTIPVYFTADTLVFSSPHDHLFALQKKKTFWHTLLAG